MLTLLNLRGTVTKTSDVFICIIEAFLLIEKQILKLRHPHFSKGINFLLNLSPAASSTKAIKESWRLF